MSFTDQSEVEAARAAEGVGPEDPWPPEESEGRSIADRAGDEPDEDEPDEMFPRGSIEGDEKAVRDLIGGNLPVEVTVSLMAAEVPSPRGGLLDPDSDGQVVVNFEPGKYLLIPKREGAPGEKRVVGWKVRQQLRPTYVQRGRYYSRSQVEFILEQLGLSSSSRARELLDA